MKQTKVPKNDAKKVFRKKGTCSHTFAYLLNREFGHTNKAIERATDPFAGGIMQKGHQCGMLWGAALAVGAEAYRRGEDTDEAIGLAIQATQNLIESFSNRTNSVNCREITGCNMDSFFGLTRYMLKVTLQGMNNSTCFNLAEDWLPEAIQSAKEGLLENPSSTTKNPINCASLVAKKMGATDEETVMVSGFAGGLGLSGNACGALSTAILMNSLAWVKEHPEKSAYKNKNAKDTLKKFYKVTENKMLCHKICGQRFKTVDEHSEFIKNGGCTTLIDALSFSS